MTNDSQRTATLDSLERRYDDNDDRYTQHEYALAREVAAPVLEYVGMTTDDVSTLNEWSVLGFGVPGLQLAGILAEAGYDDIDGADINAGLFALRALRVRLSRALEVAGIDGPDGETIGDIVRGYVEAQLWTTQDMYLDNGTTVDDGAMLDERVSFDDVRPEYLERVRCDVLEFVTRHPLAVRMYLENRRYDAGHGSVASHFGHDFFLTREGHGTGFWDRDYGAAWDSTSPLRSLGDYLTSCVRSFVSDFGDARDITDAVPYRPSSDFDGEPVTLSTWNGRHGATIELGADRRTLTLDGEPTTVDALRERFASNTAVTDWLDAWMSV